VTPAQAAPSTTPAPAASPLAPLAPLLLGLEREASFRAALEDVQALWKGQPLTLTTLDSHLEQIRQLDLPVVLEMAHPARRDTCFLALLRLDEGRAEVATGRSGRLEVDAVEIERHWTRRAFVAWPRAQLVTSADWGREALARLGYALTQPAQDVARFQERHDLVPDGALGPRTLLVLYSHSERDRPRLHRVTP
jgi:hypothetical protein